MSRRPVAATSPLTAGALTLVMTAFGCSAAPDAAGGLAPDPVILGGGASGGDAGSPLGSPTEAGAASTPPRDSGHPVAWDAGAEAGAVVDAAVYAGLHVEMGVNGAPGHIVDGSGKVVQLHGVNRSGTEFACVSGSFSDGPVDQAGIDAMKSWKVNAVRVPLNEDCWLGINGVPPAYSGASYQKAIEGWVNLLTQNQMVVVLDLHWTAPGGTLAKGQTPMADLDHAPTAWSQIARTFAGNGTVIFDLYNEPFITDWGCWVSGGACAQSNGATYAVAGMASLLQAVRSAGAENVVLLGGLAYSSDMSQWVSSVKSIPGLPAPLNGIGIQNVAASWHAYDFNGQSGCPSQYNGYSTSSACNTADVTATRTAAASVLSAGFPVVIGEAGISAYSASSAAHFTSAQLTDLEGWLDHLFTWAESQGQGYLAWSWNTDTTPVLVTDYAGTATQSFGQTYRAHLQKL